MKVELPSNQRGTLGVPEKQTARLLVRKPETRVFWYGVVAFLLLLGFFVRVHNIATLHLYGDSGYSVFLATRHWLEIAPLTAADSHPPLYYYLLKGWTALSGFSELAVRMLSIWFGIATLALIYKLGQKLLGHREGILGTGIAAVAVFQVYYSRLPRMYSQLTFFALLSLYLFWMVLRRSRPVTSQSPGAWLWLGYAASILACLYTHYFGVFLPVTEGVIVLVLARKRPGLLWRWLIVMTGSAILFFPWLLYAIGPSLSHTNAQFHKLVQPGLLEFFSQYWVAFTVGITLSPRTLLSLSFPFLVFWIAATLVACWKRIMPLGQHSETSFLIFSMRDSNQGRARSSRPSIIPESALRWPDRHEGRLIVVILCLLPVLLTALVNLRYPFFSVRFLVFSGPPYYLLFVATVLWLAHCSQTFGRVLIILFLFFANLTWGYSLRNAYVIEAGVYDSTNIALADYLQAQAAPSDVAIFHAPWHIGYLTSHYQGQHFVSYALSDFFSSDPHTGAPHIDEQRLDAALRGHPRVWLAILEKNEGTATDAAQLWLSRQGYLAHIAEIKGQTLNATTVRLSLWGVPVKTGESARYQPAEANFGGAYTLQGILLPASSPRANSILGIGLQWQSRAPGKAQPSAAIAFVHLVDSHGHSRSSKNIDLPPQIDSGTPDRRGIAIDEDSPPGDYALEIGIYQQSTGNLLPVTLAQPLPGTSIANNTLRIGSIHINSLQPGDVTLPHLQPSSLGRSIALLGYRLDQEPYHPGHTLHVTLFWQARNTLSSNYAVFTHLLDPSGGLVAQQDGDPVGGAYPTARWQNGDLVADTYTLELPAHSTGPYRIEVGMYTREDNKRLLVELGSGHTADAILLQTPIIVGSGSLPPPVQWNPDRILF